MEPLRCTTTTTFTQLPTLPCKKGSAEVSNFERTYPYSGLNRCWLIQP